MSSMFAARDHTVGDQTLHDAAGTEEYRIAQLERQVEGLRRALQSRDSIGQAKGILLSHYAIGPEEAFGLLVRLSQNTNTKVADIAVAFVAGVRECGSAPPERCRAVTAVVTELLAGARTAGRESPVTGPAPW